MPGCTVMHVMVPSSERVSGGFALGPFTLRPLVGMQHQNVSVQVMSWRMNLFELDDASQQMLTINVRKDKQNMVLRNLDPPLHFFLGVDERMSHVDMDGFARTCVFWNTAAGILPRWACSRCVVF